MIFGKPRIEIIWILVRFKCQTRVKKAGKFCQYGTSIRHSMIVRKYLIVTIAYVGLIFVEKGWFLYKPRIETVGSLVRDRVERG